MKLLIIGKGFLGSATYSVGLKYKMNVMGTNKKKGTNVNVCNIDSLEKIISNYKPDAIVNCAALTNIDEIETSPESAFAVNVQGAMNVARVSNKHKIKLIHISTDSVFDGNKELYIENDQPNPINEYAKSKKLGEDMVKSNSENYVIVRTNFYGEHKEKKFLFNWIIANLKHGKKITAFNDIIFNPLEINNLAEMLVELCRIKFCGIIHLASNEPISKYHFARKIATGFDFNENLVLSGSVKDAKLIAKRPLNTSLKNSLAKKTLKTKMISVDEWLESRIGTEKTY